MARNAAGNLITCLSTGSGFTCPYSTGASFPDASGWNSGLRFFTMDVNGDGKGDLVARDAAGNLITYLSNGSTFVYAGATPTGFTDAAGWNAGLRFFTMDVNGDGRGDLVARDAAGNLITYLSNGATFVYAGATATGFTDANGWNVGDRYFVTDANGDGKSDLLARASNGTFYILASNGATFVTVATAPTTYTDTASGNSHFLMDVNGDGRLDLVQRTPFGDLVTYLFDGLRFNQAGTLMGTGLVDAAGWTSGVRFFPIDVDGDGKTDLVARNVSGNFQIFSSKGSSFTGGPLTIANLTDANGWNSGTRFFTLDLDGDGRVDIVARDAAGNLRSLRATGPARPLLQTITNGIGAVTYITYSTLTDGTVYTMDAGAAYPVQDLQAPMYVVASTARSNGIGGSYVTRYTYAGAKNHLAGGGFLGFRQFTVWDDQATIRVTNTYRQDWPYNGLLAQSDTVSYAGTILNSAVNTWSANNVYTGTAIVAPYVLQSVQNQYETNGTFVVNYTTNNAVDNYGNITASSTVASDGYATSRSDTYFNDTTNWLLGQLTQRQVTGTLPGGVSLTRTIGYTSNPTTGLMTRQVIEPNNAALTLTADYGRDAFGHMNAMTVSGVDIVSRSSSVAYDAQGRFPITFSNALGQTETRTYDGRFGALSAATDANGITTSWTYDSFGRAVGQTLADGSTLSWNYVKISGSPCPTNSVYYSTARRGGTIAYQTVCYDALDREVRSVMPSFDGRGAISQDTTYDANLRMVNATRPYSSSSVTYSASFTYDLLSRIKTQTAPDASVTTWSYNGFNSGLTNAKNQTYSRTVNSQGWLMQATDAGGSMSYGYDAFGNLTRTTDVAGNVIAATYDLRGRKKTTADPDMGTWSYAYNAIGDLVTQTDAKLQATTFTYDKLGRLLSRVEPGLISSWSYDTALKGIGKVAQITSNNGFSRAFTYDSLSRVSAVTTNIDGVAYPMSYTYDIMSRVDTITYPTGFSVKNIYGVNGYLSAVQNPSTFQNYWQVNASDANLNVTQETLGANTTARSFNAATGRLEGIATTGGSSGTVQQQGFSYDALGNLLSRTDLTQGLSETFGYDALNRLTSATGFGGVTKTYGYNAVGNLTSKSDVGSYTYPVTGTVRPHAVAAITGTLNGAANPTFSYDANGNLLSGAGRSITWTAFNLPASVTTGTAGVSFSYDANHERFKKIGPDGTTVYLGPNLYNGAHYEKTVSGGVTSHRHYIYAGNRPIAITTQRSNGVNDTRYLHTDHLGSVAAVTDETGAVVERLSYDIFGKRRNPNGSDGAAGLTSTQLRHGYTQQEHLDEASVAWASRLVLNEEKPNEQRLPRRVRENHGATVRS